MGWLNCNLFAPAATASSVVKDAAYVYMLVGGSCSGIAFCPSAPTVYSVMRMCSVDAGCVDPSCITSVAVVPGGKNAVACREPSSSVVMVPCAICAIELPGSKNDTAESCGTMTTSGTCA